MGRRWSYAGGALTLSLALLPSGCKFDSDPGKRLPHPAKLPLPLEASQTPWGFPEVPGP